MTSEMRREAAIMTAVWAVISAAGIILYQIGLVSFLLLHTTAELFSIVMAAALALLAWNARRYLDNGSLRLIGAAYLFVSFLDLLHVFSFPEINLFPGNDANLSGQFWIAARAIQAGTLLAAPSFSRRKVNMNSALLFYGLLTIFLLLSIYFFSKIPPGALTGGDPAGFPVASELIITAALILSLVRFFRQRDQLEERVFTWLSGSIGMTILAEALVAVSPGIEDITDLLGHVLKLGAFYLIYKAVIDTGFTRPMELLFSDLVQNRASLQQERDFISGVLETANAMILVTDAEGRIVRFNRALQKTTGHSQVDTEGRYIWETNIFPGGQEEVRNFFQEQLSSRPPNKFEQRILSATGEQIEVTWTTGVRYNQAGVPAFIIGTGIDISDRKKVENELRYLSSHDILTGLYNRAYFEAEMLRLADSDEFPVSIVVADLDGLKQVNDTEGHMMGDKLIQRAAHTLRSSFRSEDILARIGGDEFAVLLPRADADIAVRSGRRVRSVLEAYNQINTEHPLSMSLGFATCSAGYQLMEAFKKADSAMYAQKYMHRDVHTGS